jgi:O-antigen ligase
MMVRVRRPLWPSLPPRAWQALAGLGLGAALGTAAAFWPAIAALAPAGLLALLLLVGRAWLGVRLAFVLLPLQAAFVITAGAHFKPSEIVVVLVIAAFVLHMAVEPASGEAPRLALARPLALLVAVIVASSLQTIGAQGHLHQFTYIVDYVGGRSSPDTRSYITAGWAVYCLAAYLVVHRTVVDLAQVRAAIRLVMAGASAASAYGIFQFVLLQRGVFIALPGDASHFASTQWTITRAYSTFSEPATFGSFIVMVLPLPVVLLAAGSRSVASRNELLLHIGLQLSGLLVSFSIGQWMALAGLLPLMLAVAAIQRQGLLPGLARIVGLAAVFVVLGVAVVGAAGAVDPAKILHGVQIKLGNGDLSLGTRVFASQMGLLLFRNNPVLGVGIGNFPFYYTATEHQLGYRLDAVYGGATILTPSNVYVLLLAETGVLGCAAALNVLVRFLTSAWNAHRWAAAPDDQALLFALASSALGIGVTLLFVDNLFTLGFWLIAALLMSTVRALRPASEPPP